jgi:hypothetical protein
MREADCDIRFGFYVWYGSVASVLAVGAIDSGTDGTGATKVAAIAATSVGLKVEREVCAERRAWGVRAATTFIV